MREMGGARMKRQTLGAFPDEAMHAREKHVSTPAWIPRLARNDKSRFRPLLQRALLQPSTIRVARVRVGFFRVFHFGRPDETLLLRPTLVDAFQAPFDA